ncbi:MAG: 3-dehydroquinate synthase, partial [Anaerolineales bacterium]
LQTKLETLIDERKAHYDSFSLHVNASRLPEEVTWQIQTLIGTFHVSGMGRGYDVMVEEKGLDRLGEMLTTRGLGSRAMVVSDSNVAPLYLDRAVRSLQEAGIHAKTLVLPAGEAHKTLETVSFLWHGYLDAGLDRSSMVVALGGGVVGDLAGFASSTFMRGITWVNVPTTLLSMVDASIGGKTGFDLLEGKNLIGSFFSPALVLASLNTLDTLPEVEFKSGMAEAVKHGVIADPDLFEDCSVGIEKTMENPGPIVRQAMAVKIKIINQDPYEKNIRAALNLGHTIGHAVELVSGFKIRHGEAVSIGMVAEAQLAERLSVAEKGLTATLVKVLEGLGLPVKIPGNLPRTEIIRAMKMDKKKAGKVVRFSLPVRIGEVSVGIAIENLEEVL